MPVAERVNSETVELDEATLRGLIEQVGHEVLGVADYDRLMTLYRSKGLPDVAGSVYLESLLELAA